MKLAKSRMNLRVWCMLLIILVMVMCTNVLAEPITNNNSSNDEVYATFNKTESEVWGDKHVNKYEMTIHNNSDKTICNWKVTINENSSVVWENGWGWCADYVANGNKLIIMPQSSGDKMGDSIQAHSTYASAGFYLIASNSDLSNVQISYEYGNYSTPDSSVGNGNTGNGGQSGSDSGNNSPVDTSGVNITGMTKNLCASETPVGIHGKLAVNGIHLVDKNGKNFQLRGVSTHGINWFSEYVNKAGFQNLRDEWGVNAIRLAMYTIEYNGYCAGGNQNDLKNLVTKGVDYATELGMYVIVDWHILNDKTPLTHMDSAKTYFDEMSKKFASYDNVLYEICNEPNGGTSWEDIKKYAEVIIPIIRNNDKDAIIIVGTPNWSQDVDIAAQNRVTGYDNIMYTIHFYSNTHQEKYRNKMVAALEAGLPVFCTEYGVCNSSGDGGLNLEQGNVWLDLMDKYEMSYFCWSLTNKGETASLLKSSTSRTSGYQTSDLSDAGKWLVSEYNKRNANSDEGAGSNTTPSGNSGNTEPSGDSGSNNTGNNNTGNSNTNTGSNTGSGDNGSSNTGSNNTGSNNTGNNTGSGDNGSSNGGNTTPSGNNGNTASSGDSGNNSSSTHPDGWETINGKSYWYEGGIKQGTYSDAKGVIGDGTVRGREIYDPVSDGWYWLDSCYDGAKAVSKEVWMPYIYQGEEKWAYAEIEMNAKESGDMKNQVIKAIQERTGKWVRYDANGKMYKGWYTVEGSDVSLYPNQAGNTYYYDKKTGLMAKGYVAIDGRTYHFDEVSGALIK